MAHPSSFPAVMEVLEVLCVEYDKDRHCETQVFLGSCEGAVPSATPTPLPGFSTTLIRTSMGRFCLLDYTHRYAHAQTRTVSVPCNKH